MKKLNLNKQKITELSVKEMESIEGGRGGWSNMRTGNCRYSMEYPVYKCVRVPDRLGGYYEKEVMVGCIKN